MNDAIGATEIELPDLVDVGIHLEAVKGFEAACSFVKTSVKEDQLLRCQTAG